MSILSSFSRRDLLVKGSKLSVASFGLLAGLSTKALAAEPDTNPTAQDIDVLNVILGTEHEGIATYQICMERGLLHKDTTTTARLFQDHHKKHRDILIDHVRQLGGLPVVAKASNDYVDDLNLNKLKTQTDALTLILRLERSAANAYIGMIPSTNDHELIKVSTRIAADEVIHWTTLSSILRLPLPPQALTFGA